MRRVLVVRHAIAELLEEAPQRTDAARRLSERGRRRMRRAALGLHQVVDQLSVIGHSPLIRAVETAQILDAAFLEQAVRGEVAALAPGGSPAELFAWVAAQSTDQAEIALVGHEPDLSAWVGRALCAPGTLTVVLKKGAAVLLEFPSAVEPGAARLLGHYAPRVLRALAEASR